MRKRIAVYPGSFDPIHHGHLDLVARCRPIFDEVVVAVLGNDEKQPMFSVAERVTMIEEQVGELGFCRVESFSGLLVDYLDRLGATTIIRGLRAVSDFEYEFQMALMNRHLNPRVETVFMMPRQDYSYLSSRLVKEVFRLGGNIEGLVPPPVIAAMAERLAADRVAGGESAGR
ncbi:MAG: pantetheine-phosphate adenylyltransferase [Thermoanaerobaculia bacterium]|jgi:pantetheine-phosphate adenylyltransferase|nr:MAG: pantetheine-phosphate adenylyltransferase [Thermoanaerobaculia bacterium]MBZ0100909.1 pantetheine-phosphate adenylyltransferase [Thermoanaerobaculia bacterium]